MVHFSSMLSGHLALVARNDPLTSVAAMSPDSAASSAQPASPILVQFEQAPAKAGLLVTEELKSGIERVKKNVTAIVKACRARNVKFRDVEFDLEEDRERCLHGLDTRPSDRSDPSDVQRVSQIFRSQSPPAAFFVDGASSTDVVQGALGDCWFLSAAAAVASKPELVENFCVARDEQVGVYGFMFQRNGIWVDVIVDDLLYTSMPKYEELTSKEQQLYHEDKDKYNGTARLGSKSLYFAKSGTPNETWVPLLEKAYAKLHGDYAALTSGHVGEAMEDMTGGVSTVIHVADILDPDQFWKEELLRANEDRLFGCSIYDLRVGSGTYPTDPGYGPPQRTVNGLYTAHAYSIVKAVEYKGKRFLRIRNPWGNSEWTGRWSDGSKEWTHEWIAALERLGHGFGDDGAFVMEYEDFLDTWTLVHRTRLFDPSWVVSSLWMNAKIRLPGMVWDYGDVSFTFSLPARTPVIIVLSKLDDRYARGILDRIRFSLDFQVYKKGEAEPIVASRHSIFHLRSVNAEAELDKGEYVVHVRIDSEIVRSADYLAQNIPKWNTRKIAQVLTTIAETHSILANFPAAAHDNWLRRPAHLWAGRDLQEIQSTIDRANAAASLATPLPYPSTSGYTTPAWMGAAGPAASRAPDDSARAFADLAAAEQYDSQEDYSQDDDDDEDDDEDAPSTIGDPELEIPGFPLAPPPRNPHQYPHSPSASHSRHNSKSAGGPEPSAGPLVVGGGGSGSPGMVSGGLIGSRSPQIIPGSFDVRGSFTMAVKSSAATGPESKEKHRARRMQNAHHPKRLHISRSARSAAQRLEGEPTPVAITSQPTPVRRETGHSEISNISTAGFSATLAASNAQAATARILENPEIMVSGDPELAVGLRVYTKNYGTVEIKGQIRQGGLYQWKGVF